MNEVINFYIREDISVLFGPVCDYAAAPVARQINYWNLPMVSIGAMAQDFFDRRSTVYPMLTRAGPSFLELSRFFASAMREYKWKKMKLIYQKHSDLDIIPVFCHLVSDTFVQTLPDEGITLDYRRLDTNDGLNKTDKLREVLLTEVGMTFSGKMIIKYLP